MSSASSTGDWAASIDRKDAFFLVPFAGSAADAPVLLGRGVVRVPRSSLWHPADHFPRRRACCTARRRVWAATSWRVPSRHWWMQASGSTSRSPQEFRFLGLSREVQADQRWVPRSAARIARRPCGRPPSTGRISAWRAAPRSTDEWMGADGLRRMPLRSYVEEHSVLLIFLGDFFPAI